MFSEIKAEIRVNPIAKKTKFKLSNDHESLLVFLSTICITLFAASLFVARLAITSQLSVYRLSNNDIVLSIMLTFWVVSFEAISLFIYNSFERQENSGEYEVTFYEENPYSEVARLTNIIIMPDNETFCIGIEGEYQTDDNEDAHKLENTIGASIHSLIINRV